jgi:hypothetical protein
MAGWFRWLMGLLGRRPTLPSPPPSPPAAARWLPVGHPHNPFDVEILDLMALQQVVSTTTVREHAERSVSWGASTGEELDPSALLTEPPLACALRYPAAKDLPDGLLYEPLSMDFKWVLVHRQGRVLAVRSWTGHIEAVADVRRDGDEVVLEELRFAATSELRGFPRAVDLFDWLIRVHVWDQRLPLPVDDDLARQLELVPLSGFGLFGKALFCAAKDWRPPPPPAPLRAIGPVVHAVRQRDVGALEAAIRRGAAIDTPSPLGGRTALHLAIGLREPALVRVLLDHGADPALVDDRGLHALGLATVAKAPIDLLDRLAGVDVARSNHDGFTPLHAAAEVDNGVAIPWLVARGVPLQARTRHGHTALHVACALGHVDAARALLAAGADREATSPEGGPRDIAVAESKPAAVALLDAYATR